MSKKIKTPSDTEIEKFVFNLMKSDPVKFIQYCLVVVGNEIIESKSKSYTFSQYSTIHGKRYKIKMKGTIKEVTDESIKFL